MAVGVCAKVSQIWLHSQSLRPASRHDQPLELSPLMEFNLLVKYSFLLVYMSSESFRVPFVRSLCSTFIT